MTLREEIVKYSGEELLSEEVLEEAIGLQEIIRIASLGVFTLANVGIIAGLLSKIKDIATGMRAIRYLKIESGDKKQLEEVIKSNENPETKKNWIRKILSKYIAKAKETWELEREYHKEQKNIKNFHRDERATKRYLKKNFHGSQKEYDRFNSYKEKRGL